MSNEGPVSPFSVSELLHLAGAAILGLVTWVWNDKMKAIKDTMHEQAERTKAHDLRLQVLETEVARKSDITQVYDRLNEIQRENSTQNTAILNTLLQMRK